VRKPEGRRPLGIPGVNEMIILKGNFNNLDDAWTESIWLRVWTGGWLLWIF
jgi:hypothetical protein